MVSLFITCYETVNVVRKQWKISDYSVMLHVNVYMLYSNSVWERLPLSAHEL